MTQPKNSDTSAKRKVSEMISEMAAGFLGVGDTIEERQNRLNGRLYRLESGLRIARGSAAAT